MSKEFHKGQKVSYYPGFGEPQLGIIKSFRANSIYIVFNCAGNWQKYEDYSATQCNPAFVYPGWNLIAEDLMEREQ